MQHRVSKLVLLALLCLASTRAHGVRPIQALFHLADSSHPLVIDNRHLPLASVWRTVFHEAAAHDAGLPGLGRAAQLTAR